MKYKHTYELKENEVDEEKKEIKQDGDDDIDLIDVKFIHKKYENQNNDLSIALNYKTNKMKMKIKRKMK